ncbi:hypothetical protein K9L97_02595 [Candidatus Woesearchaeota archaeon]|nr:hypothetical protein [Candidatus Woesearchaeota archaeon]
MNTWEKEFLEEQRKKYPGMKTWKKTVLIGLLATEIFLLGNIEWNPYKKLREQLREIKQELPDFKNYNPQKTALELNIKEAKNIAENSYELLEEKIEGWINLAKVDDNIRVVFDKNNLSIVDTVEDSRKARKKYFDSLPDSIRKNRLTYLGRKSKHDKAYYKLDKYKLIFETILSDNKLSVLYKNIPKIETLVAVATSSVYAQGYWQIMKSAKGNLEIDRIEDQRNSLYFSTKRASEILKSNEAAFEHESLSVTAYIRGQYGEAKELEEVLGLEKEGKIFAGYSEIILFHQPNDLKIYSKEEFEKKFKRTNKLWVEEIKENHYKITKNDSLLNKSYQKYLEDVKEFPTDKYIKSFFTFHNLERDYMNIYMKYHEYLMNKNFFSTANYFPRLLASHFEHERDYNRKIEPISYMEVKMRGKQLKEALKNSENRELNRHVRKNIAETGNTPRELTLILPGE